MLSDLFIILASTCPINPLFPVIPKYVEQNTRATLTCIIDWHIRNNLEEFSKDANSIWGVNQNFTNLEEYIKELNRVYNLPDDHSRYYESDFTNLAKRHPFIDFFIKPFTYKCVSRKGVYGKISLSYKLKLPKKMTFNQLKNIYRKGCIFKIPDHLYDAVVESAVPESPNNELITILTILEIFVSYLIIQIILILDIINSSIMRNLHYTSRPNSRLFPPFVLISQFLRLKSCKTSNLATFITELAFISYKIFKCRTHFTIRFTYDEFFDKQALSESCTFEFITLVRVLLFICVNICIIAVDFITFPPSMAKSKLTGMSLMDVGEGCFILTSSLISPLIKRKKFKNASKLVILKNIFKKFFFTILLGFGRLFITTAVKYPVPVTEYGYHGNFFFVLAIVFIISEFVLEVFPISISTLLTILYTIAYEFALNKFDILNLLSNNTRDTFALKNLESIVNIAGLTSLYMSSYLIGHYFLWIDDRQTGRVSRAPPVRTESAPESRSDEVRGGEACPGVYPEERSDEGESRDEVPRCIASKDSGVYPEAGILPAPCYRSFEGASTKGREVYPEERRCTLKSGHPDKDSGVYPEERAVASIGGTSSTYSRAREGIPAGEPLSEAPPPPTTGHGKHDIGWLLYAKILFLASILVITGSLYYILGIYGFETSRVMANARYNLFILFTSSMLLLISLLFIGSFKSYIRTGMIDILNFRPLRTFIFCNVMTGLINMFYQTKILPSHYNLVILFIYTLSFIVFASISYWN